MRSRAFILLFACAAAAMTQTVDRTKPPKTADLEALKLPPVYETTLPNGMHVMLVENNRLPLVTIRLAFAAGSRFDPPKSPGLSEAVASLLSDGTKKRTSRQIAEQAADIGGSLSAASSTDSLTINGSALSEHTAALLDLVADIARNASFPAEEIALYKQNRAQRLLEQKSRPDFLTSEKLNEVLFGSHPYAHRNPTQESIEALDAAAITGFRDRYLRPNNGVLIVLGKIAGRDAILKLIREGFGSWERKDVPAEKLPALPTPSKSITLVDRPGSVQADIQIGHLGIVRTDPAFFPLVVGNAILGGGTSSRLFNEIREKKGYAYSVYSFHVPMREAGTYVTGMQVRNEVVSDALEGTMAEMRAMGKTPVTAAELSGVKNYLSGAFVLRLETQEGLAAQLVSVKTMGLPIDYLEKYTARVRSVEPDKIQAIARRFMSPDDSAVVVVGDASKIKSALDKFGKVQVTK
ncbi:MAG: pitrilysin family protein [Bryobacteraceae bacterium]